MSDTSISPLDADDRRPTSPFEGVGARDLLDGLGDAVVAADADGTMLFVNPAAATLFGYRPDELVGRAVEVLLPEALGPAHVAHRTRGASAERPRTIGALRPLIGRRRDGRTVAVQIGLSPVDLPGGRVTFACITDATLRAEAEERGARSRQLYSMLAGANAAVLRATSRGEVYQGLCDVTATGPDVALAWVAELDGGDIRPVAEAGTSSPYVEGLWLPRDGTGPVARALARDRVVLCRDTATDPDFAPWRDRALAHGLRSACALPLRTGDSVTGAFAVASSRVDAFDDELVALLTELAADASVALGALANREAEAEARRTAEDALQAAERSEARMGAALALGREIVALCDPQGQPTWVSASVEAALGHSVEAYLAAGPTGLVHPDDVGRMGEAWYAVADRPGANARSMGRILHADGSWRWMEVHVGNHTEQLGEQGFIVNLHDVSEVRAAWDRLEAKAAMQAEVARIGQLALSSPGLDAVLDAVASTAVGTLGGRAATFVQFTPDGPLIRAAGGAAVARVGQVLTGWEREAAESFLPHLDEPLVIDSLGADERGIGAPARWFGSGAAVLVRRHGEPFGAVGLYRDDAVPFEQDEVDFLRSLANVVESAVHHEDAERDLVAMALHDALTGLPNRTLFGDRATHAIERAQQTRSALAVLLVDLDRFKLVNDAMGHLTGDRLLVDVAGRLSSAVRPGDTVARLGGDEFAVFCEDVRDAGEAACLATRIGEAMAEPFDVDGTEIFVTASVGIAVRAAEDTTAEALLREADAAMYRAKDAGRARHEIFDDDMRQQAIHRLGVTNALRRALERDELRLRFQPEVPLGGGEAPWTETLLRWEHPDLGLVGPGEFMDVAEDTGLIVPIGEWVLREACSTMAAWHRREEPAPSVISVNLSARQLTQPDLVAMVAAALADSGLDPSRLMLEITETAVMEDPDGSVRRLSALRDLGVGLAIDDFGTGYSSLAYLHRLPVTAVKVDRSFVSGGPGAGLANPAIVEGILGLSRAVGLVTVAEGVETAEQCAALRRMGCPFAQGYLFSRPVDAAGLGEWLAVWHGPSAGR